MASHGLLWPAMAGRGLQWPAMAGHDLPWPGMTGHGLPWPAMAGQQKKKKMCKVRFPPTGLYAQSFGSIPSYSNSCQVSISDQMMNDEGMMYDDG